MAETRYHEIMGWHDHRYLPARTGHVIGVSWDGILAETINPKKGSIDWEFVGHPSWRWCTDEFDITLGQNAFSVPDTILEIKIAEPRPIAGAPYLVTLSQEIAERISFDPHRANAKLVEQSPLRK